MKLCKATESTILASFKGQFLWTSLLRLLLNREISDGFGKNHSYCEPFKCENAATKTSSGHCHLCFFLLPIDIPRLTPLPHFIDRSSSIVHIITHVTNKNRDEKKLKKNVFRMIKYRFKEKRGNDTSWPCFGLMTPF